ncbi:MAG: peptidoglycan DD-metalloendopeptidase family protein [Marinirhabdus sp.]
MKLPLPLLLFLTIFHACDITKDDLVEGAERPAPIIEQYGFVLNNFEVVRDTVRPGDTFGTILEEHGIPQGKILEVATKFRDSFDVRKIVVGKPYVLLNDSSTKAAQVFIYEKNKIGYAVVDFRGTLNSYTGSKPVTYEEKVASGIISNTLSQTMDEQNLGAAFTNKMASIYAWTVNFHRLAKGDRFKVIYTEKLIDGTTPGGIHEIKAAYFEHRGRGVYAFNFETDSINGASDHYDEKAENLKRPFLKSPIKFDYRISSRYNLKRRIKYYGYKLRPHKGTDFAANIGTPILATADGVVGKSEYRRGNGNYVKVKHNATYETQYLHMKKRNVRVGEFVRQGDVLGWVGMTGNTGGPHVCYRFWKNGKQVDPFKEDLPMSNPLPEEFRPAYFEHIAPFKESIDCISY